MLGFGGFLNSTFWSSYRSQSSASIEELLSNKDCTVEKLLEDDDCLQEFKNLNDKLIQYFDHDKMKSLIDLITVMPPSDATHNRGHKFPFIASEIFNCEINSLLDKFFDAPEKKETGQTQHEENEEEEEKEHTQNEDDNKKEGGDPAPQENTEALKSPYAQPEDEVQTEEKKEGEQTEQPTQSTEAATEASEEPQQQKQQQDEEKNKKEPASGLLDKDTSDVTELDKAGGDEPTPAQTKTKVGISEPEEEDKDDSSEGKYLLLARLFRFVRTKNTPLNPVLSGYFAKLVTLLINRKQKNLIPYVFSAGSDAIDCLLYHVYQKSIAELLNKFLNIQDHDFETELGQEIKRKQHEVLQNLVEKLGPNSTEEDHLNASSILQDMLEGKDFYNVICQRKNILRLIDFAFTEGENPNSSSQNAALSVLVALVQIFHEKKKDEQDRNDTHGNNDDEDGDTIQQDDEETQTESPLIEILASQVHKIANYLSLPVSAPKTELDTSYDVKVAPLGHLRLRIIELLYHLIKLKKPAVLNALAETAVFAQISKLIEAYPWNNFLQLKVQNLYEEIFDSKHVEFRSKALQSSNIAETLVALSKQNNFTHQSNRTIRHGHMALVTKLANLLLKHKDSSPEVQSYLGHLADPDEWRRFVEGELKRTNDTNNKNLGGQQPRSSIDEEDGDKEYEMNMEKIMAKFSNFNNSMSNSLNNTDNDDPDEVEDDDDTEIKRRNSSEDDEESKANTHQEESKAPVTTAAATATASEFKEPEPLVKEYTDNNYWKLDMLGQNKLDDLLADYE